MNEEFGFHVEMETERLVRDAGLDPREARRRARAAFGGVEAHKEALRDGRGWAWLTGLTLDLKLGYRVLEKARGWTLVVLVSLALGIGANTALFSAVDGMLFRTLPVADPDGLVRLRWTGDNGAARNVMSSGSTGGMGVSGSFSYPVFEALRDANETLAGMLAATLTSLTLVVDGRAEMATGRAEMATGLAATGDYFRVLGVQPAAGRAIARGTGTGARSRGCSSIPAGRVSTTQAPGRRVRHSSSASSSHSCCSSCAPTWPPCCCRGRCHASGKWRSACRSALRAGG